MEDKLIKLINLNRYSEDSFFSKQDLIMVEEPLQINTVNMDGKVTSCVLQKDQSTLVSTPLMMKAKNSILTGLTFERGYAFPEFHYGFVTIEVVQHNE